MLTIDQAQPIIDQATEVSDGLFVFIDQGKRVLDCTSYDCAQGAVFAIEVYEPNGEIDPVMNVSYVTQDFDLDNYTLHHTEYFATAREMKARVCEFVMNSAYF